MNSVLALQTRKTEDSMGVCELLLLVVLSATIVQQSSAGVEENPLRLIRYDRASINIGT